MFIIRLFLFVILITSATAMHIRELRQLAREYPDTKIARWQIGDVVLTNVEICAEFLETFTIQEGSVQLPSRTVSVGYTHNMPYPEFPYTNMIAVLVEIPKEPVPKPKAQELEFVYISPHDYSDFFNLMKGTVCGGTFNDLTNLYSDNGIIASGNLRAGAQLRYGGRNYIGPGSFIQGVFHQL